jgi:exodeoxyribonuclease V alpha subunit
LAALTSHQFGRGHACLDLDLLSRQGVALLGWDASAGAAAAAASPALSALPALTTSPTDAAQAAATLPWIQGEASPMVLDGPRLYLRRNWQAERSIRAALQARLLQPCALPPDLSASLALLFPGQSASLSPQPSAPDWQKSPALWPRAAA